MPSRYTRTQMARIVFAVGWADFSLKYRGSLLGYAWSLLGPLVQFVVILHVFRFVTGEGIPHYPLYLFLGIIVWEHFALSTAGCIAMLHEKMGMIEKVSFPRILLPLSVGWTHIVIFSTRFLIFVIFALLFGARPTVGYLLFPLVLLQMTLLALGCGMMLAAYALRYRDIGHLWSIALQILFWLTPVMYGHIPEASFSPLAAISAFIRLQPLSLVLRDARQMFLYLPDTGFPPAGHVLMVTAVSAAFFVFGALLFARRSRYFVQEY